MLKHTPQRYARRFAKGIWWLATPWRMPERMQVLRERAVSEACTAELAELALRERARVASAELPAAAAPYEPIDLFDDDDVAQAVGLPWESICWPPLGQGGIRDRQTAARFCLDVWRERRDIRERFPRGLSDGSRGEFGDWLKSHGTVEWRLDDEALRHLLDALDAGIGNRARQAFLSSERAQAALPHGLTPPGMRDLFRSFIRHMAAEAGLEPEEVWWMFLDAAMNPAREITLAYSFAPAWQKLHPEGLTVFGCDAFAAWFASAYGVSDPSSPSSPSHAWLAPAHWPSPPDPATQIRLAYSARPEWRAARPDAMVDAASAGALLDWLVSTDSPITPAQRDWCASLDARHTAVEMARPGANVIGHFCYPSGLRVSVESMVQAMRSVGVATSLRDVLTDARDDPRHVQFRGMESHDVTILHTQPEPFFDDAYARAHLFERDPRTYRIAYWYWEFDSIPDAWLAHEQKVDEVWTATEFVARGLRERLGVPVRTMFPGVKLASFVAREKAHFGLREGTYTFLFTFHMVSVMERKNPLGLIRAFKSAFTQDDDVCLVLKTSFADRHPAQFQALCDAAAGANIQVIDQVYTPDEVLSLMNACDAYVSLHRSEGLGLTMAEAMLLGKPVIATGFSGNVDFMDSDNSLLVPYELVKLDKPIPPYEANLEWAEPSVEHAAQLMRRVYDNPAWGREIGEKGRVSAETGLSLEAAGRRIAERLAEIRLRRSARARGE